MAVWLKYGIDAANALVHIDDVKSGRSQLGCPYCGMTLIAKKGQRMTHHFAHDGETCAAVSERGEETEELTLLPLYERFALDLGKRERAELVRLWENGGASNGRMNAPRDERLIEGEYLRFNSFKGRSGGYEFTKLGKIPLGGLSLPLFGEIQRERFLEQLSHFQDVAENCFSLTNVPVRINRCMIGFPDVLVDYRLYRAQLRRVLSQQLYFLRIELGGDRLYKIGVTQRTVEARMVEIERELKPPGKEIAIRPLGQWEHWGSLEHYFKFRFREHNQRLGNLTEYFRFDADTARKVLRELRRLKPRELNETERQILAGEPSAVEREAQSNRVAYWQEAKERERQQRRSKAIRTGMQRAARWGQHVGRPKGEESATAFLAKPKNQVIVEALQAGLSLRQAAKRAGASVNTVRKVKRLVMADDTDDE